jgi:hypothetical protein
MPPGIGYFRRDLVSVVEAAEHDSPVRQPRLFPRRRCGNIHHAPAAGLIGEGHAGDGFREPSLLRLRRNDRIADDVVHDSAPHRPGKAEEADLHGRRSSCQDLRPAAIGIAHEVDQDVDPIFPHEVRRVVEAERFYLPVLVENPFEILLPTAAVIIVQCVSDDLERSTVMERDHLRNQGCDGMLAKIG